MHRDFYKKEAEKLVDVIVNASGGPLTTRADAVNFATTALFEAYRRGWDDKQRQLADNMYPR